MASLVVMGSPVNIQEPIGKTVGRREGFRDALSLQCSRKADMIAWRKAFPGPFVPKGIYRFKTHEEADAWMLKMLTRIPSNPESPQ